MSLISDTGIPDIEIENNGTPHDSAAMQGSVNCKLVSMTAYYVTPGDEVGMSSYDDTLLINKINKF